MLQIILYNQINTSFLQSEATSFLYIHHTGKIKFLGEDLNLNTFSKVLDYSCGKNFVNTLKNKGLKAEFIIGKSYFEAIKNYTNAENIQEIVIVKPIENYFYENLLKVQEKLKNIGIKIIFKEDNISTLISHEEFLKNYKNPPIMEYFYRFMRKKFNILMDENGNPIGGQWNFDKENRKFSKNHKKETEFLLEKNEFLKEAEKYYDFESKIVYPTNREEAFLLLEYFLKNHLENFGKLEDAMYKDDYFVHHSLLSTAINFGLLSPLEVIKKIESEDVNIESKEGFIRQILGWREFMFHFFSFYKDDIYKNNFFSYNKDLDNFFRGQDLDLLKMNCLKCVLKKVNTFNYSHHIERLMVIGNFALLYGYNPLHVNKWFFEMYSDAFEWVVSPNVLGMSQYSDGGRLATKPYVSSGNYINNMSDYCKDCFYDVKEKYSENACPFNYLYWNFVYDNKEHLKNKRQSFLLKQLENIDIEKIKELKERFRVR